MTDSLETNFRDLLGLLEYIPNEQERGLWEEMLMQLSWDKRKGFETILGMTRAPAAKGNHHDVEGGLVIHLLEMWKVWEALRPLTFNAPYITDERVIKAIIAHDLHKAHNTFRLISEDPWQVEYADQDDDQLVGSDIKSIMIMQAYGIHLDHEQMNALINAEGGYSKIKTRWQSSLSKLCYCLDELSGNVIERNRKGTVLSLRRSETHKHD